MASGNLQFNLRLSSLTLALFGAVAVLSGCLDKNDPPQTATQEAPAPVSAQPFVPAPVQAPAPAQPPVASNAALAASPAPSIGYASPQPQYDNDQSYQRAPIYTEYRPQLVQPQPVVVQWAPPPLLVQEMPPPPSRDAYWTGGYWVWRDQWVWAPGRWAQPPRPHYSWVPPYYEHRQDRVVFVDGFWAPPGVSFRPPPSNLALTVVAAVAAGIIVGRAPHGPEGAFVPPPPGSHWGLIVPAPRGTPPDVVAHAPAIINSGMRVTNNVHTTNVTNNTVVNNIRNVTIEAPAASTANHQEVRASIPANPRDRHDGIARRDGQPPASIAQATPRAAPPVAPPSARNEQPQVHQPMQNQQGMRPEQRPPSAQLQGEPRDRHENNARPIAPSAPAANPATAAAAHVMPAPHPGTEPRPEPRPDSRPEPKPAPQPPTAVRNGPARAQPQSPQPAPQQASQQMQREARPEQRQQQRENRAPQIDERHAAERANVAVRPAPVQTPPPAQVRHEPNPQPRPQPSPQPEVHAQPQPQAQSHPQQAQAQPREQAHPPRAEHEGRPGRPEGKPEPRP